MRGIDETAKWPGRAARHLCLLAAGLLFLTPTACSDSPTGTDAPDASTSAASATNSNAPFQTWHQGFNHGTEGRFGKETPGSLGWCGTVEQVDRRTGDLAPSAGRGYAVVTQDPCNDFWAGIVGPDLVNAPWAPGPTPDDGGLSILGHRITEAGWYTFRHVFGDDSGALSVDFKLAHRSGGTLFSEPISTRFFSGLSTSDLVPTELASGYLWFARIADGLELPIDEHRVRRGQ